MTMKQQRVICLIDMDCFYVQVEELATPGTRGKPCGVSQYNPYRGGGLIAVNYEARKFGVKRGMRGEEAKALCPDFHTFYVSQKRGKADLTKYREASAKIFDILLKHCECVEKASIDEAYLDLTDLVAERMTTPTATVLDTVRFTSSFVVGTAQATDEEQASSSSSTLVSSSSCDANAWLAAVRQSQPTQSDDDDVSDAWLAVGAAIVETIRDDIFDTLGYCCSAGVAHNKTLAKFCCALNKPNKQTILPLGSVAGLLDKSPVNKIKNLGGKLGQILGDEMGVRFVGELARLGLDELRHRFGEKTAAWLHAISHGVDDEPVMARQQAKSIGCSKNFRGKQALDTVAKVHHWCEQLCDELEERLASDKAQNGREASLLVVSVTNEIGTFSKSSALNKEFSASAKKLVDLVKQVLATFNKSSKSSSTSSKHEPWQPAILTLALSATKFVELSSAAGKAAATGLFKYFANSTTATTAAPPSTSASAATTLAADATDSNNTNSARRELGSDLGRLSDEVAKRYDDALDNNHDENDDDDDEAVIVCSDDEEERKEKNPTANATATASVSASDTASKQSSTHNKRPPKSASANSLIVRKAAASDVPPPLPSKSTESSSASGACFDESDYVRCDKCNKRILCWNMPEHDDFHFAQQLSREICVAPTTSALKRSSGEHESKETAANASRAPLVVVKSTAVAATNNAKKLKTNQSTAATAVQSANSDASIGKKKIDSYFSKLK